MPQPLFIIGTIFAFVLGITVGSFLNVCIYRLPEGESIVTPPSHCPKCNHRLLPPDLIPLLSYLLLGRRCRYCRTPISSRYFFIEFITGLLFIAFWVALVTQFPTKMVSPLGIVLALAAWTFAATMLVTFMIDLDTTYVIEPVTWLGMGAGLVFELVKLPSLAELHTKIGPLIIPYLPQAIPGMIVGFLFFVALDWLGRLIFRKPSMGLGDAFIGAAIGAMLGPGLALLSFGIAIVLGAVVGIVLIVLGHLQPTAPPDAADTQSDDPLRETDDEEEELPQGRYMPFGPFLTASAVLVALAPGWIGTHVGQFFHWWFIQNPLVR